jgi:hypothetical protein
MKILAKLVTLAILAAVKVSMKSLVKLVESR